MTDKPFVVSARVVIGDGAGRCLVLQRSHRSTYHPGLWEFPGGKGEPGETLSEMLIRETREETGLDIRLRRVVGSAQWEMPQRIVAFLFLEAEPVGGIDVRLSDEHEAYRWHPRKQLAELAVPDYARDFVQQYASGSSNDGHG